MCIRDRYNNYEVDLLNSLMLSTQEVFIHQSQLNEQCIPEIVSVETDHKGKCNVI